jgi:glyoxylase-like metal-dependent hydrolase (beta-lactamase superfamily II)
MRPTTTRLALLLGSAAQLLGAAASQRGQEPTFALHAVAGTVSYLEGAGGNIGICVGADGALVVDTQLARFREEVVKGVDGATDGKQRFLLNTHWHSDHTGNNEPLGERGVPIVAHANVRRRVSGDDTIDGRTERLPAAALPVITFDAGIELHLNGERITVRHYGPGHTDGDSVVWFHGSQVVHTGDLFFKDRFPYIDLGSGGSVRGYRRAVAEVLAELPDGWKVIPGHGAQCGKPELQAFHDVLSECIERVEAALARGEGVETMLADGLLDDHGATFGQGFVSTKSFLEVLATDLAK